MQIQFVNLFFDINLHLIQIIVTTISHKVKSNSFNKLFLCTVSQAKKEP